MEPSERVERRAKGELELKRWLRTYGCLGYGECMEMMDVVFMALYEDWRARREALRASAAAIETDPDPE